jgi:hypothetical protein
VRLGSHAIVLTISRHHAGTVSSGRLVLQAAAPAGPAPYCTCRAQSHSRTAAQHTQRAAAVRHSRQGCYGNAPADG